MTSKKLVTIDDKGNQLNCEAGRAFLVMDAAIFAELGIHLPVNVSVRDPARQKTLFAKYVKAVAAWVRAGSDPASKPKPVAEPGKSEHDAEKANAVDINQASDTRILPWLCRRGPEFGFYATATGEKWHWAYYEKLPLRFRLRHEANLRDWGHAG